MCSNGWSANPYHTYDYLLQTAQIENLMVYLDLNHHPFGRRYCVYFQRYVQHDWNCESQINTELYACFHSVQYWP